MKNMNDIKQIVRQQVSSERFKYKLIIYSITMVHIVLFLLFGVLRIWPMVVFNIGSIVVYIKCIDIISYWRNIAKRIIFPMLLVEEAKM